MDWGILQGLGQGLQEVGMTQFKATLDEKLRKAREAREEELTKRKEQRQADRDRTTPDPSATQFVQKDGVWHEQIRSKTGNILEERLAPENKVREFNKKEADDKLDAEKDALAIRTGTARVALAEKELANYDEDRQFERSYKMAGLESRSRTGAYSDDKEPTEEDVVSLLVKENQPTFNALAKQYEGQTSATDLQAMVRRSVKDAYARGINPNAHLQEILKAYEKRLKAKGPAKGTTAGSKLALDLTK